MLYQSSLAHGVPQAARPPNSEAESMDWDSHLCEEVCVELQGNVLLGSSVLLNLTNHPGVVPIQNHPVYTIVNTPNDLSNHFSAGMIRL